MLEKQREVVELAANGVTKTQIARQLNIGEASVYGILAANKKA
ncbi:helix-turn-helix domain-containing protein [Methylotuvimicrobium sp. KM2]